MSAWPVIVRELRAEARRPANYWLRVIGAGLVLLIVFVSLVGMAWGPGSSGRQLFMTLHWTLFASICITVPLLTADCISGERREGTLGLLFLTPLSPGGIMAGKSFAHALRSLMLVLVTVPVMGIAFVLGGVTQLDLIASLGMNLSALCLALAASLIASTWARERIRALVLAEVLTACLVLFFARAMLQAGQDLRNLATATAVPVPGLPNAPPGPLVTIRNGQPFLVMPPGMTTPAGNRMPWSASAPVPAALMSGVVWSGMVVERPSSWARFRALMRGSELFPGMALAGAPPGIRELWLLLQVAGGFAAVLMLRTAIWLGGRQLRRLRQEEPPSPLQIWIHRTFCTPAVLAEVFRRRMTGMLDRNPVGWLQHYSWSARATKWGWCALMALAYTVNSFDFFVEQQPYVLGAFAAGVAFAAANSFRRERQSGALELLLVTPLTERQIIWGRLRGIWWQFLPALAVWWLGYQLVIPLAGSLARAGAAYVPYQRMMVMMWATLPVIGLYASLRWRNLLVAWLATLSLGLALPWFVFSFMPRLDVVYQATAYEAPACTPLFVMQGLVAVRCYRGLWERLRSREFAL